MLSINTNLSSLIAQNSMKTSTDKLNQAIERMTTGLKINHASDNAANYSISTNLTTQLSAYDTAADNVAMGMDLVNYASDIISQMQDKAARLNALSTQARNGTNGTQSLSALNSEASAIMSELMRLYSTAEYNDISLFNRTAYTIAPHLPQAGASGFIDETALISQTAGTTTDAPVAKYDGFIKDPKHPRGDAYVDGLKSVTQAIAEGSLTNGGEYKVGGVDDLKALATYVNGGNSTSGMTFIMSEDIDLSGEANWTPIGIDYTNSFKGNFDGNGHVIKNLKIDRETSNYQGLFGYAQDGEIKNIGLENVDIKGKMMVGGLVGSSSSSSISNSYATGNVTGQGASVGGLAGDTSGSISNSYATGSVSGAGYVGGLVGSSLSTITNSYATGAVSGTGNTVGGLAGHASSSISNSYATGAVSGKRNVGGLVGSSSSSISNSYATGDVTGHEFGVGGLAGNAQEVINCFATGDVKAGDGLLGAITGGLVGQATDISNSYATGNVSADGDIVGGLAGYSTSSISNSYATGNVTSGGDIVGGLAGGVYSISNSYASGNVSGNSFVGGLAGMIDASSGTKEITNSVSYATINGTDSTSTGSLIGGAMMTDDGVTFGTLNISNTQSIAQDGINSIGGVFMNDGTAITYDLSPILAGITDVVINKTSTDLQVGIYGNASSRMNFDTNFSFDLNLDAGIESVEAFNAIVAFENLLSEKATQLGAVQNRLDSALESIEVNINNLTSSRSTIRDADIAEVSSEYIRQQILQQASATLMATANQSPAIALQLI